MRYLVQRVSEASVHILDTNETHSIGEGFLVYMGIHRDDLLGDRKSICEKFARRIKKFELFGVGEMRKKVSFSEIGGEILLISNFTLYGRNKKGGSVDFTHSAGFEQAKPIYEYQVVCLEKEGIPFSTGMFGAQMEVKSINFGPVNVVLDW